MISGIGNDIVNITRIESTLEKFSERFPKRILSNNEYLLFKNKFSNSSRKEIACYLAKRFAAKEALSKAVGIGISGGLRMNEIEILNNSNGKPIVNLINNTKVKVKNLLESRYNIFISLSDDFPNALATVVIEIYDS